MPRSDLRQDDARDYLLTVLNRRRHWVLVCLGQGGRFVATQIGRRHYVGRAGEDWTEIVLPGPWFDGVGLLPIAVGHKRRMTAGEFAAIVGEFTRAPVTAEDLEGRRLLVVGDAPPDMQRQTLQALNAWLTARPDYQNVGVE